MSLPGGSNEQDTAPSRSDAPTAAQLPAPKQIRFVSHDGQPHAKRRRVNAACQTCRKRKTRCSGERPECSTCTENGHACGGYEGSAQARKASPNHSSDEAPEARKDAVASKPANGGTSNGESHVPVLEKVTSIDSTSSHENALHRMNHDSPNSSHTTNSMASARNRVPYFRYFGPTAIVPGFKQMVVQMRDHRRSFNSTTESPGQCPASLCPSHRPNLHQKECATSVLLRCCSTYSCTPILYYYHPSPSLFASLVYDYYIGSSLRHLAYSSLFSSASRIQRRWRHYPFDRFC